MPWTRYRLHTSPETGSEGYRRNLKDLDRVCLAGEIDMLARARPDEDTGHWCGERDAASRRIRLVVANDVDGSSGAAVAEGDARTESHLVFWRWGRDLGGGQPGAPIAKVALHRLQLRLVALRTCFGFKLCNACLDLRKSVARHQIRASRYRQLEPRLLVLLIAFAAKCYAQSSILTWSETPRTLRKLRVPRRGHSWPPGMHMNRGGVMIRKNLCPQP